MALLKEAVIGPEGQRTKEETGGKLLSGPRFQEGVFSANLASRGLGVAVWPTESAPSLWTSGMPGLRAGPQHTAAQPQQVGGWFRW